VAQAGTSAFGSAANAAVSASSQTAVLLGTSAASGNVTRNDLTENFGSSKAFICYLGLPMDNDIHYEKYVCSESAGLLVVSLRSIDSTRFDRNRHDYDSRHCMAADLKRICSR